MKRILGIVICISVLIALATAPIAGAQSKLEGVWKMMEVTTSGPNARTFTDLQPGLYIFTKKHYSIMYVSSDKPRPELPEQNATDAQKASAWGPFTANSGTYEIKGTTLTLRPIVAKNPNYMTPGKFGVFEFKLDSNTLLLTQKATNNGPVSNPAQVKLLRIE